MTSNILPKSGTEVSQAFQWKQAGERPFLSIDKMATSHLFNVLKMIWNHTVPEPMKIRPFKEYRFGSFYTPEYMASAVKAMVPELLSRRNISAYEQAQLSVIMGHISTLREGIEHD